MQEVRRKEAEDGSFALVFLEDGLSGHQVELTWLRDRKEPYNLGDNEIHMAMATDNLEAARAFHAMGIYFISDPDGYWTEIVPAK